ncbi:uncharacterized protein DMAD_12126 [Drosophila madeirensis]|uniref:Secreted protein n=1 Tax=Drosophila madeirensis TaxID=30013 RepID=A0AAU9FFN7_DROMD|nr:uncharacterized protein LOC117900676 [Drosophila subobscura]
MWPNFVAVISILCLALVAIAHSGPVPIVNEHQQLMPKVPQWHCLRYFKHDVLMMRRCRHLRVPTAPRLGDVVKRKKK